MIDMDAVLSAARRLEGVADPTPVLTSRRLDEKLDANVYIKAENYQRTGSFKFRGAYNRISRLSAAELARGVVAVSSGNHAQAVALAAQLCGATAVILMPEDTPVAKLRGTSGYGAEIVRFDRYAEDRDELVAKLATESGRVFVPPYDHPHVMAGQGTVALELLASVGSLDVLVVPMSGGGLMAGCGVAARSISPSVHLVGVEPEAGDDTKRSLAAGERVSIPVPRTIADGLQMTTPGELTFEINKREVDEVVLVSDAELVDAMRLYFDQLKTVAEPSGSASLAALRSGRIDVAGRRVGIVLSGGNVGAERFAALLG